MKKIKSLLIVSITSLAVVSATALYYNDFLNIKSNRQPSQVINIKHDWKNYSSVADLVSDADLIVCGKVISDNKPIKNELKVIINEDLPEAKKEQYKKELKSYEIVTESQIQISKIIKGSKNQDDIIRIQQTGGTYENITENVEDIRYLKNGEEAIFFLCKTDEADMYVPINARQSHNYIISDKVMSNPNDELFISELNTDDFIKEIEGFVGQRGQ